MRKTREKCFEERLETLRKQNKTRRNNEKIIQAEEANAQWGKRETPTNTKNAVGFFLGEKKETERRVGRFRGGGGRGKRQNVEEKKNRKTVGLCHTP